MRSSQRLERPAGTIETGATTAYDPIIGAAASPLDLQREGSGMTVAVIDTGVDYNNPRLGAASDPATRSSPASISPTTPPIPWPRRRSTARPSPA